MCDSLEGLSKTFMLLNQQILPHSGGTDPVFGRETVDRVTESIISCAAGVHKLRDKLEKVQSTKPDLTSHIRRAQYPFRTGTLMKLQRTVDDLRANLSLAVNALGIEATTGSLQRLSIIGEKLDSVATRSQKEEDSKILKWLSPTETFTQQINVFSRCHPGSGTWFLDCDEFQAWREAPGKILYCEGMPGAGKTILTSIAVNELQQNPGDAEVGVAYFYCSFWNPNQSANDILGSLLQQLARQSTVLDEAIKVCYEQHAKQETRPHVDKVSDLLSLQCQKLKNVYILIDALDECKEGQNFRKALLIVLGRLVPITRLMVTSRPISSIAKEVNFDLRVNIKADDNDVRSFLEAQIKQHDQLMDILQDKDYMRAVIFDSILHKTNGM